MLMMLYNKLMDNKERISQGGGENQWEGLKNVEFSAEKAQERANLAAQERAEKSKEQADSPAQRAEKAKPSVEYHQVEKEYGDLVRPKVIKFPAGTELGQALPAGESPSDYIKYPSSEKETAAVKRELSGQSFVDQIYRAESLEEFQEAKALAKKIESDKVIANDKELQSVLDQVKEHKASPAYKEKEAFFALDGDGAGPDLSARRAAFVAKVQKARAAS